MPHFITFKSESFLLQIHCELPRNSIELYICSNETLNDLRTRIANALGVFINNVQIYLNDKLLNLFNDNKLITHLGIDGMTPLNVKLSSSYGSSLNQTPVKDSGLINFNNSTLHKNDPELEKSFPGVLISNSESAFDMLYRLEDLEEPKINSRVRNILKLIPTNPRLLDAYDRIIGKMTLSLSHNVSSASVAAAAGSSNHNSSNMNVSLAKSPSVSSMINSTSNFILLIILTDIHSNKKNKSNN